ncbi:MAG: glyoxalase superfamily protein [Candidatus Dormiibacterota bacterium]
MTPTFRQVVPILRMFDVAATLRFYCEYLGCQVDWQEGEGDRPIYVQVSRDDLVLHLSSHHGDGTPGTAVYIETKDAVSLHRELHAKGYPFLNPGFDPYGAGRALTLIDPASNVLRFFEPPD